jgi:hypothetical protein
MHVLAIKPGEPGFDTCFTVFISVALLFCVFGVRYLISDHKRQKAESQQQRGFEVKPITDAKSVPDTKENDHG